MNRGEPDGALALSARIASGDLSPAALMAETLDRIAASHCNAIVSLRPRTELMAEAEAAANAPPRGWLHGLPIAVKDLVATAGLRTTWGSPLHADHVPDADDLLAARLRVAGAILIGKTNTPEFGLGSNTFNPVHGITRNPYDASRTPGGSSGGAAVALAEGLVAVADGSDMMGSLRNPAAFCNVYGMRPTAGLVPADPVNDAFAIPLSTEGPMARDPQDLAALLHTLAGPDPRWPHACPRPPAEIEATGPLRIGWPGSGGLPFEDGILEACETALPALGRVMDIVLPVGREALWDAWTTLRAHAVATKLAPLWADPDRRGRLKSTARWEIERGLALTAAELQAARQIRARLHAELAPVWDRVDALAMPSAQVLPFSVETEYPQAIGGMEMDTYHRWMEVMILSSLLGLPAVACPVGFVRGLPIGLQLIGPRGADGPLLALAARHHAATRWPQIAPPAGRRGDRSPSAPPT
jgi:amidase